MPQDPFPEPGYDGEEPDGFPLPPAAGETGPAEEDGPGLGQGLYMCLPAEQVTLAGFGRVNVRSAFRVEVQAPAPGPYPVVLLRRPGRSPARFSHPVAS